MNVDELYESIKAEGQAHEAEADKVSEAEVTKYNELHKCFGLPGLTPEAAAEAIRAERASVEAFKAAHPMRWAEAEADAERSRGFSALRRKLDNGRAQHEQEQA